MSEQRTTAVEVAHRTVFRKVPGVVAWLAIGVLFVTLFSAVTPFNMDEFIHYHPLLCHYYPGNMLNTFRENCRGYDLNFANTGWILPLRAFPYSGSFPGVVYLPLFLLWPSPLSARFLGLLYLAAQAGVLSRMSGIKFRWIMLGLVAFFPYAFQHLVDTGPIGFDITSIFLIVYCIDRWLATQSVRYPIACALLVFCGIWTKLVYFWFVPGLAILFLYACITHWATVRKHALRLGIQAASASVLLVVLLSLLLFSTAPGNSAVHPFLSQLAGSEATPLSQYLRGGFLSSPVVQSLANPYQAIQRVFDVPLPSYFSLASALLFYCSLPFIAVVLFMLKAISGTQMRTVFVQYVAFLATIMMIGRTPLAMFMHHAVLSLPFLILAVVTLLGSITLSSARQLMLIPAFAFVSVNLVFYGTFSAQPIRSSDDPSKLELHAVLRDPTIARDYFLVITDWGMYYYQGLYGDHAQSVLYVQPLNKEIEVGRLLLMSAEHKRNLLFVFNSRAPESDLELIRSSFNVKPCSAIDETAVWQMLIEDDGNPKNPCFQPSKPTRPSAIEKLKELAW